MDAEYFQEKYDEIKEKIKAYSGGWKTIEECFYQNKTICNFKKSAYNYIEISDINTGDGSANCNLIRTNDLPDNAKIAIQKGDLVVSKVRPYRWAVSIIDIDKNDLIASGAFTVLREKSGYKKEVLQVLLRTNPYKDWLWKWNVGTSYPVIKDEDILSLPIPLIPFPIQQQITDNLQQSVALQKESKELLEKAKREVENEIEKE